MEFSEIIPEGMEKIWKLKKIMKLPFFGIRDAFNVVQVVIQMCPSISLKLLYIYHQMPFTGALVILQPRLLLAWKELMQDKATYQ